MHYTIVFSLLLMGRSSADLTRPKRIIGGGDIYKTDDKTINPWRAMYYYVWYGYTFLCYENYRFWQVWSYFKTFVLGFGCGENEKNLICHGALISPKIVQTACVYKVQIPTGRWTKALKMTEFETKFTVYMGEVDVKYFNYGVKTTKFVIHQRCGQLQREPSTWRNDIAWIVLDKEIHDTPGAPNTDWGRIQIAGPYKSEEIEATYKTATEERHVCLILGFGTFQPNSTKNSKNLRYAWIQMLDDGHCKAASWTSYGLNHEFTWDEVRTWACAVPVADRPRLTGFPMGGKHGAGDSGGPVSCDNNYFAVLSSEINFRHTRAGYDYMMFEMPIKYVMEANAVEYRKSFEYDITQYNQLVLRAEVDQGRKLSVEYKGLPTSKHINQSATDGYTYATSRKLLRAKSSTERTGHLIVLVLCLYVFVIIM